MRTLVDKKRMGLALAFLAVAVVLFGVAVAIWSADPAPSCLRPGLSNTQIRDCVAQRARETEPDARTLAMLLMGGAFLTASVVSGFRSLRRVMTIPAAAEELGLSPADVRQLIDRGFLEVYDHDQRGIYLDPEDVRRFGSQQPPQDQLAHT